MLEQELNPSFERFRKGDTFVEYESKRPLTFMLINSVEGSNEYMDFCQVTWYTMDVKGPHIQRRFPMAARDGRFSDFLPIPRKRYHEAVKTMRKYGSEVKELTDKSAIKAHYIECNNYLNELIKDYIPQLLYKPGKEEYIKN